MGYQLLDPGNKITHSFAAKYLKQAREKLDLVAEQERVGWRQVQLMAQDYFGKTKEFTVSECKYLMEEIKRGKRP